MHGEGPTATGRQHPQSGSAPSDDPVVVPFAPAEGRRDLPAEVFTAADFRTRIPDALRGHWERLNLHLLVFGSAGDAAWGVDFGDHPVSAGAALRVRPGQLIRHPDLDRFEGWAMVWPVERHPAGIDPPSWRAELDNPVSLLPPEAQDRMARWLADLQAEQQRFDGSAARADLMGTMLRTVLLTVAEHATTTAPANALPQPYIDLREALAVRLFERPAVAELARSLGYSTRTLDRACQTVTRQNAKQVIDERVSLELRRMLADERMPITEVRLAFGFLESSNFTKFVRRVTGRSPSEFRSQPA